MEAILCDPIDRALAARLRTLRAERGWTLEELARRSGVSRAALSRLENAEVSPTAAVLGRLCTAHGLTLSRLMQMVEADFAALVPVAGQTVWEDRATGFRRRMVSPPARSLAGEVIEVRLAVGASIAYDAPPRAGLEHHLVMIEGALRIVLGTDVHDLAAGDCLRYRLEGASSFAASPATGARYLLFMV